MPDPFTPAGHPDEPVAEIPIREAISRLLTLVDGPLAEHVYAEAVRTNWPHVELVDGAGTALASLLHGWDQHMKEKTR